MNNDEISEELAGFNMKHTHIHSRADELIACLEGEIAKRDARIVELERNLSIERNDYESLEFDCHQLRAELAAIKAQGVRFCNKCGYHGPMETHNRPGDGAVCDYMSRAYAAPVSDAQAQGVVMPDRLKPSRYELQDARVDAWNSCLDEVARLNAAPAAPAADSGLVKISAHWSSKP